MKKIESTIATDTTTIVTLAKAVLGLLSEFPLNIILIGSLAGVAFKMIRGAKGVAKN